MKQIVIENQGSTVLYAGQGEILLGLQYEEEEVHSHGHIVELKSCSAEIHDFKI